MTDAPPFPHVLSPFRIGSVPLRNRVVRTAQGTGQVVGDDLAEFLVARARGGVALAFADIGQAQWSSPGMIDLSSDRCLPGSSFLSPATNHRTDSHGGCFTNRTRFLRDVLREVRAAVGPDYPVGVRVSPDGDLVGAGVADPGRWNGGEQTTTGDVVELVQ